MPTPTTGRARPRRAPAEGAEAPSRPGIVRAIPDEAETIPPNILGTPPEQTGAPSPAEGPSQPVAAPREDNADAMAGTPPGVAPVPGPLAIPQAAPTASVLTDVATDATPHLVDLAHKVDLGPILQPLPPAPPDELIPDWLRRRQTRANAVASWDATADARFAQDLHRGAVPATYADRAYPALGADQPGPPPTLEMSGLEALVALLPFFAGVLLLLAGVGAGTVVIPG